MIISFEWPAGPSSVQVTGPFSEWSPIDLALEDGGQFRADIEVGNGAVVFKFIVDGLWTTDPTQPTEVDADGNVNNVRFVPPEKAECKSNACTGNAGGSATPTNSSLASSTTPRHPLPATPLVVRGDEPWNENEGLDSSNSQTINNGAEPTGTVNVNEYEWYQVTQPGHHDSGPCTSSASTSDDDDEWCALDGPDLQTPAWHNGQPPQRARPQSQSSGQRHFSQCLASLWNRVSGSH